MSAKTQIEVSVNDKATFALQKIKTAFAGLNDGKVGAAMARVGKAMSGAGKVVAGYAVAGGAAAAAGGAFAKSVIDTASQFEKYQTVLGTLEGSSEKAKESMSWVSDFAAKTPYELDEVMDSFVKLKAYGMDPMKDGLLTSLGDTAAAMGKPVMQAVEAIADAVTGENERLKEFGIKASKIKGSNEIEYSYTDKDGKQRLAKAAADNREQIQKTLQTIWNEKYGGAMDKLSGTWEGMMSNLADQWARFKLMIADTGVFDFLKDKLGGLLDTINKMAESGELKKLAESIGNKLVNALKTLWDWGNKLYEKFVAFNNFMGGFENTLMVLVGVALLPLIAAIGSIAASAVTLGIALAPLIPAALGVAAAFLPWIAAAIAIGAIAYLIWDNWEPITGWIMEKWNAFTAWFGTVWETAKSAVSNGLSNIGAILAAFNPIAFVAANFGRLGSYIGGIFDGIKTKAAQILNLSQSAQNAAASMPSPSSMVRGGAGRVDVNINHGNVPRGTTMQTKTNNRVNLTTKQGYAFAR